MIISSMVNAVITKIVAEQQKKRGFFQDRKDCLIMYLVYVNKLVSALERLMGKNKRFPLKLVFFIAVYKNIITLYLEAFVCVIYVIKDCLA